MNDLMPTSSVPAEPPALVEPSVEAQKKLESLLLANDMLSNALEMRCSDFQIEPDADCVLLRYLINHETVKELELPKEVLTELTVCYKALAGLNTRLTSRPQDKRAVITLGGKPIELRVTSIPGMFGETIAMSFKFVG